MRSDAAPAPAFSPFRANASWYQARWYAEEAGRAQRTSLPFLGGAALLAAFLLTAFH
jgi:hypothetical protein